MKIIEVIFSAIISIAFFLGFLWVLYYLFNKFFGIQFTTRTGYSQAVDVNKIVHKQNVAAISEFDADTIADARKNLNKKLYANTSNNILAEIHKVQLNQPPKNEFIPDLFLENSYDTIGIVFKDAFYCCYYSGVTTYLQFTSKNEGFLALTQGEPKPFSLKRWFKESNRNVVKFEYMYYSSNMIRISTFHTGKKYTYDITCSSPDYLNVSRHSPYSNNIINLNFVLC